ncbi:helix-turn-helix domain-containing protein [Streptomyces sp. NPDC049541]|uniref:helix-turn-helix domain-containing protein n=1 Tax=Streptomyces sp. NPDC049541 TaxID=3365594 RepID=UPI0037A4A556
MARASASSSEIERGEVAELATLSNVLRELFNTLGISQRQYARRISLDPSAVSRYLAGQRLPTRQFVERLISEVEEERGDSVTVHAKEAIRTSWLTALRACDPDEFQLESLRGELARAKREAERAHRSVEALHLLLEQKEAQVREAGEDLARLQLDWSAERADATRAQIELRRERESLSDSQEALRLEIERLRNDLREAERLRAEAECHSRELRERVLRLEAELAERGPAEGVPLEAFKAQLERMWEEENFPEATRDFTEAAWARPVAEVLDLAGWLAERGDEEMLAAFVTDVCRLRPAEDVVSVARGMGPELRDTRPVRAALVRAIATRLTVRNAAFFHQGLDGLGRGFFQLNDMVLGSVVRRVVTPSDAIELISRAVAGSERPRLLQDTARAVARRYVREGFPFVVALGLAEAGLTDVGSRILSLSLGAGARISNDEIQAIHQGLGVLDERGLRALFSLGAARPNLRVTGRLFATVERVAEKQGDLRLLDLMLETLWPIFVQLAQEYPDSVSRELRAYAATRIRT